MGNVPHRLGYLNTRFPLGGAVWEVIGTFKRGSFAGGSRSVGEGFEGFYSGPTSCLLCLLPDCD